MIPRWKAYCIQNKADLVRSLLYTLVIGLLAHGYFFVHNSISHDLLNEFVATTEIQTWKMRLGRVFWRFYKKFFGGFVTLPWLNGIIGLVYIAMAVYLLWKLFDQKSRSSRILTVGICTVNVTMIALIASCQNDIDCSMLALVCAVLSAVLWKKKGNGWLWGIVPAILALGLYQSYFSVTITLILFVSILDLYKGEKTKDVFVHGLKGIAMLACSGIGYLCAVKLVLWWYHTGLHTGGYNSLNTIRSLSVGEILSAIASTFTVTWKTIFLPASFYSSRVTLYLHVFLIGAGAVLLLKKICTKDAMDWKGRILILVLIGILPWGMNSARVFTGAMSHDLMHYALWLLDVFVLVLAEEAYRENPAILEKSCKVLSACVLAVVVSGNVHLANEAYLLKDFAQDATLSYLTRVTAAIENTEGYVPGESEVVFVGKPYDYLVCPSGYEDVNEIFGLWESYVFMVGVGYLHTSVRIISMF